MPSLSLAGTGVVTGLSLIVAIGSQNAFVLRQGLLRQHVGPVVALCAVADMGLIAAGVAGLGTAIHHVPWVVEVVRWFGVAFLVGYGARSLVAAARPRSLEAAQAGARTRRGALATAAALTFLNPHVYLDTVLLVGSIANQHGPHGRWWFATGAMAASVLWFTALGFGARSGRRLLASARAWQVLDVLIGLTMLAIAVHLALGHVTVDR